MSTTTRLALRDEVVYILGNRTELQTNANDWVRRAYQHLTQSFEFPEAATTSTTLTTVGIRSYPLPGDYFSVYSIRNNTSNRRLVQLSRSQYDELSTIQPGPAEKYAVVLRTLYIHPTPNAIETLQIHYRKIFADLSTDGSLHELPDAWDQCIVQLASAFGFDYTNELERSTYYKRQAYIFMSTQQSRLSMDLYDRNEAIAPIGMEL